MIRGLQPTWNGVSILVNSVNEFDVSVVIPTFNRAHLVTRAVDSVLAQTRPVREIIVVDDGSKDDTSSVVRQYEPHVRYIYEENAGVSAARNHGIREAVGEWIAFLDADDEWLSHKMQSQTELLKKHSHLRWCSCNMTSIRNGKALEALGAGELRDEVARNGEVCFFEAAGKGLPSQTSGFMIHRSVFATVGGFDVGLPAFEDIDMWWRIGMRYPQIGYCADPCHRFYPETPGSLTKGNRSREMQLRSILANMKRAEAHGSALVKDLHPLARKLAVNYLLRIAGGQISISAETVQQAKLRFPLSVRERMMMTLLRYSPGFFARRLVNRISL